MFSLFLGIHFPDYLDVVAAVVAPCGVGKTFSLYIKIVLIFFHTLVFQEYCALIESRIRLGPGPWVWWFLRIPLVLTNRTNQLSLLFSYIIGSLYFQIICGLVNLL